MDLLRYFRPQRKPRISTPPVPGQWLRLAADVETSVSEGELVCLDTQGGRVFTGNSAAAFVWQCAVKGLSRADTASEIATRYRIAPEQAEHDLCAFIETLEEIGLTRPAEGAR